MPASPQFKGCFLNQDIDYFLLLVVAIGKYEAIEIMLDLCEDVREMQSSCGI